MTVFFDTNVLVYCTDTTAPDKQARAKRLVALHGTAGDAVISTQVLIELFNVLTRKQKMPAITAQALIQAYALWTVMDSDVALVTTAISTTISQKLSIWDAMVVAAAQRAQADTLYTEDLTHGQRFGKLTVENPFL
jgi:predicted nucleic acid-binding protein